MARVDPCLLVDGTNVLAVEVHQASPTSSDVSFDLALASRRDPGAPAPCGVAFRRGDCNDDGAIDISDAVCILNWLFLGAPNPGCLAAANPNGDPAADFSDSVCVLGHLFLGGPPPAEPFLACGPGLLAADAILGCAGPPATCP